MGLFEAAEEAMGVYLHAISACTTPEQVVTTVSKSAGREVNFHSASNEEFTEVMKAAREKVAGVELLETMQLIGGWEYYRKDVKEKQSEHDEWLLPVGRGGGKS